MRVNSRVSTSRGLSHAVNPFPGKDNIPHMASRRGFSRISTQKVRKSDGRGSKDAIDRRVLLITKMGDARFFDPTHYPFTSSPNLKILYDRIMGAPDSQLFLTRDAKFVDQLRLFGRDALADASVIRYYPNGVLIKESLEHLAKRMMLEYGAIQLFTSSLLKDGHKHLARYQERFTERHFLAHTERQTFFLRRSTRLSHYNIFREGTLIGRTLPQSVFEMGTVFPLWDKNLVRPLWCSREVTLPEMHTMCRDLPQAKGEFSTQLQLCLSWLQALEFPAEVVVRVREDFYGQNKPFVEQMARLLDKPCIIEMVKEDSTTISLDFQFYSVNLEEQAVPLSYCRLDIDGPKRFGIIHMSDRGTNKGQAVGVECSFSGPIEQNIAALLDHMQKKFLDKGFCQFPFWLAPTQVRMTPFQPNQLQSAQFMRSQFSPFRCDIDDSGGNTGAKIKRAFEVERIPVFIIYNTEGERVKTLKVLLNEVRKADNFVPGTFMNVEEIQRALRNLQGDKPLLDLPLPPRLSQRVSFHEGGRWNFMPSWTPPTNGNGHTSVLRGSEKLQPAMDYFGLSRLTAGKEKWDVLDIGCSKGGFLACELKNGCQKAIGLDLKDDLIEELRVDPRVKYFPHTDVFDFTPADLSQKVDLITIDVAGPSILEFLDRLPAFLTEGGLILAMVKLSIERNLEGPVRRMMAEENIDYQRRDRLGSLPMDKRKKLLEWIRVSMQRDETFPLLNRYIGRMVFDYFAIGARLLGFEILDAYESQIKIVGGEGMETFCLMKPAADF